MVIKEKFWLEGFTRFFEAPSREGLLELLRNNVGESNTYDFKREWPVFPKVARHLLGLANSGGGALIVGVEEKGDNTFVPVGVERITDKSDIDKSIQKFVPFQLKYEVLDFSYEMGDDPELAGKKFQVLLVDDRPEYIPFVARASGDGVRESAIYVRRGTGTEEANYEELQEIINRRLETVYSSHREFDLNRQLAELKALYNQIPRYRNMLDALMPALNAPNPHYPTEDFEIFILRMIEEKKKLIQSILLNN